MATKKTATQKKLDQCQKLLSKAQDAVAAWQKLALELNLSADLSQLIVVSESSASSSSESWDSSEEWEESSC